MMKYCIMVDQLLDVGSAAWLGMILACSEHLQKQEGCWKFAQVEMLKKHGFEAFNYKDSCLMSNSPSRNAPRVTARGHAIPRLPRLLARRSRCCRG